MTFALEPHVAGELGPATILDPSLHPPIVTDVEYVLDHPDTDDLIESFPVFLVSEALATRLTGFPGIAFGPAVVRPGDNYLELFGDAQHKQYVRLLVGGGPDLWIGEDLILRASDRAMVVLREFDLRRCDISRVDEEPPMER
jgi:hypothetical protein